MNRKETCNDVEWMVGHLVDGELPESEAGLMERHLSECPSCQRLAEDFRSFDRLARKWGPPPPVPPQEWSAVLERVRREPIPFPGGSFAGGPRRRPIEWVLPVLSLAALALVGAWILLTVVHEPPRLPPHAMKTLEGVQEENRGGEQPGHQPKPKERG